MITKDLVNIGNARITGKVFASKFIGTFNGTADSAAALTTNAGTATKPVYFSNGKPVATTYALQLMTAASASAAGAAGLVPSAGAGANKKFLRGDATWASIAGNAYATCTTAAATAAKVATISGSVNWELVTGAQVTVFFSYTNSAQNPTLNVNGTGAKPIKLGSTTIATTHLSYAAYANRAINFIYDGSAYQFIGWSTDTNTTYSAATSTAAGLMSAADKSKLDGIQASADAVSFTQSLTSGTKIGSISINGGPTDIFAPTTKLIAGASATATANAAASNGSAFLNVIENGTVRSSHKIVGSGGTTVTTDANGVITIKSTDNNTTYTLSSFGITATAAELNILDGVTVTAAKINYLTDVTSNIQAQLNGKAASSHGTHVTYATAVPLVAGTAAVGTAANVARGDHVHPAQTTISGNAGSATKLATARTIDGVSFNGSAAITHFGTCDTAAGTAAKTVALTGFSLVTGARVFVKFTYANTAANPTLNVNSTGAKAIIYRGSAISAAYLRANGTYEFLYDGTNWNFVGDLNVDTNTTYTNASLGQGFGTCDTAAGTAAKTVALTNYALTTGGIVSVKFTYAVPANATMNINSKGAKSIFYKGVSITAGVINAGDIATFIYDGTQYHLISLDSGGSGSSSGDYIPTTGGTVTGNVQQSGATTDYTTYKFRNIAVGTSATPTSNATYGVSGSIYIYI